MTTETALPVLTGSEKQIAWATDVRQDLIDQLAEMDRCSGEPEGAFESEDRAAFEMVVNTLTDASVWIAARHETPDSIISLVQRYSQKRGPAGYRGHTSHVFTQWVWDQTRTSNNDH